MRHAQDGKLNRYKPSDIADACEWIEDENVFFEALIHAGFIDKTETGHSIHDWYDYAGKLIELRAKDAERKRNSRGKNKESKRNTEDVQEMSDGHPEESERNLAESIRNPNPNPNPNIKTDIYRDSIKENLDKYKVKVKGVYELEQLESYEGVIDLDVMIEAIKISENKNVAYVKSVIESLKNKKTDGKPQGPKQEVARQPIMTYEEFQEKEEAKKQKLVEEMRGNLF